MTEELIELNEDEFNEQFPLAQNHLNESAGWVYLSENDDEQRGCLFETYGEELEFVRKQNPRCIWTLIDGDDGDQYLISGYHFANRIGYLISVMPLAEGKSIQVHIPMEADGDSEAA